MPSLSKALRYPPSLVLADHGHSAVNGGNGCSLTHAGPVTFGVPRSDGGPGRLLHARVATPEGHAMRTRLLNQFRTGRTFDCWTVAAETG